MGARRLGLVGLAVAAGLLAVAAAPAGPAAASGPAPADDRLNHGAHAAPATTSPGGSGTIGNRATAIARAKLKPTFYEAKLSGANEVPGAAGTPAVGDPDGSAVAVVKIQGNLVWFALSWKGIGAPTLGHIHQGVAGVNGEVKVGLFTTAMPDTVTAATGVARIDDAAVASAIVANPQGFYVNLHSAEFPGGALRGQLSPAGRPRDMLALLPDNIEKAFLSGDQEVPTPDGPAVGDPFARAVAFVDGHDDRLDYAFAWIGVQPTLGHIHRGQAGVNGAVVVPLFTTAVPATVVAVAGTVGHVDAALLKEIDAKPSQFYANLHSAQFPGGAVRGQLFKRQQ